MMGMTTALATRVIGWARLRKPDFVVGGHEDPYLLRWFLLPRNPIFNVYLHLFLRSDDDRALHDHPWLFNLSWLIDGSYVEHTIEAGGIHRKTMREAGQCKLRWGPSPHRVELLDRTCWTVFVTGPRVRAWGFHCPQSGWVHWKKFTAANDPGGIGPGCGGGDGVDFGEGTTR